MLTVPHLLDGAGLFCGVIKHLLSRGVDCPKVLATTHFHDVFGPDMLDHESLPVSFLHMEVMFVSDHTDTRDNSDRSMTPRRNDEMGSKTGVLPGERITYLYRWD